MLANERQIKILNIVNDKKNISVSELKKLLNISESTIRRDLSYLNSQNKLVKVHGGAACVQNFFTAEEADIATKKTLNIEQKKLIGKRAAALIKDNDFVYIDAGTTTETMTEYINQKKAVYITNGIETAKKLAQKGFNVNIICGRLKKGTEAIVGGEAVKLLKNYHFTLGFFGTNGINLKTGFTTPDIEEASVKEQAIKNCRNSYILADSDKLNKITAVSFAALDSSAIITVKCAETDIFKKRTVILEV